MIQNQEKSFGRSLHAPISNIWRLQIRPQSTNQEPTRHSAYVTIAGPDIDRPDLFKPAPYLTADHQISPKCLFRIRTQHTKEIPTHQHLKANLAGRQLQPIPADMRLLFSKGIPYFLLPNLDSVNHCTSKYLSISILISLLVQWLTK